MKEKKSETNSQIKKRKKRINPDNAHWVKSQAKLMKILEAAGMAPESQKKMMITCNKDR